MSEIILAKWLWFIAIINLHFFVEQMLFSQNKYRQVEILQRNNTLSPREIILVSNSFKLHSDWI